MGWGWWWCGVYLVLSGAVDDKQVDKEAGEGHDPERSDVASPASPSAGWRVALHGSYDSFWNPCGLVYNFYPNLIWPFGG